MMVLYSMNLGYPLFYKFCKHYLVLMKVAVAMSMDALALRISCTYLVLVALKSIEAYVVFWMMIYKQCESLEFVVNIANFLKQALV